MSFPGPKTRLKFRTFRRDANEHNNICCLHDLKIKCKKKNSLHCYRVSQTILNHNHNLFLIGSSCFCLFGWRSVWQVLASTSFASCSAFTFIQVRVLGVSVTNPLLKIYFVLRCCNSFHQRQMTTKTMCVSFLHCETKIGKEFHNSTNRIEIVFRVDYDRKRHGNFADYFCWNSAISRYIQLVFLFYFAILWKSC